MAEGAVEQRLSRLKALMFWWLILTMMFTCISGMWRMRRVPNRGQKIARSMRSIGSFLVSTAGFVTVLVGINVLLLVYVALPCVG